MVKDLKVLTYRWHCAHQYELWKLGFRVHMWHKPGLTLEWESSARPLPSNASKVSPEEADREKYDLVILHFDENILTWEKTRGVLFKNWGTPFKTLKNLGIPKVAICHGTPPIHGRFDINYPKDKVSYDDADRKALVDFLGDIPVVCNSYQAQTDWGFKNSRVIWHGIDPDEFPYCGNKNKNALMVLSNISQRPWYQGYFFAKEAMQGLGVDLLGKDGTGCFKQVDKPQGFADYRRVLGEYRMLVNPTRYSPMPRSRIEAAMMGACVVTTNFQDEDRWIKQGETGFYTNNAAEMREIIQELSDNPSKAIEVGKKGRDEFAEKFNVVRYLEDWRLFLKDVLG